MIFAIKQVLAVTERTRIWNVWRRITDAPLFLLPMLLLLFYTKRIWILTLIPSARASLGSALHATTG